jgi:hypothetical protein
MRRTVPRVMAGNRVSHTQLPGALIKQFCLDAYLGIPGRILVLLAG